MIETRLQPKALDAEDGVISAIMLDPSAIDEATDIISPSDFYKTANQMIFQAMIDLDKQKIPVDLVSLAQYLKDNGDLEKVGGGTHLAQIIDTVPRSVSVPHHSEIVEDKSLRRQGIAIAEEFKRLCFDDTAGMDTAIDATQRKILALTQGKKHNGSVSMKILIPEALERLEKMQNVTQTGVPTGYLEVDELTNGLQKSDLIIMAARPSVGKTALALNMLRNMVKANFTGLLFSVEMSRNQLMNRLLSAESKIHAKLFRNAALNKNHWEDLNNASARLYEKKLFVNDEVNNSRDIIRETRKCKKMHDIDVVFIDYLQLCHGDRGLRREEEVAGMSRDFKQLAKELDIPVVALAQLNRQLEQRGDKRPMLSDLRESGAIEQDADIVMFIYRDDVHNPDDYEGRDNVPVEINFAKHRNGATGVCGLLFEKTLTLFKNRAYGRE